MKTFRSVLWQGLLVSTAVIACAGLVHGAKAVKTRPSARPLTRLSNTNRAAFAPAVPVAPTRGPARISPGATAISGAHQAKPKALTPSLLNIDFGGGTATAEVGPAAIGQTNDFWNFYSRDDGNGGWLTLGAVSNLVYSDGSPSKVGVVVANMPGAWSDGSADPMYNVYLYPFGGTSTLSVTNLPSGNYDFYLYAPDGQYHLTVSGTDYGIKVLTNAPIVNPVVWQEGVQYVVMHNVAVVTGQSVNITIGPGVTGYALLAGLQIAKASGVSDTLPPVITTQPASQALNVGSNATFTVLASGTPPLTYQWLFNSAPLNGQTAYQLVRTNVQTSDAGSYQVVVANNYGRITSAVATLAVSQFVPSIVLQPTNQTVAAGGTAMFTVGATGASPLLYQWRLNGTNLLGATRSYLPLAQVQPVNAGGYSARVSNAYGAVTSATASLVVTGVPPSIVSQPSTQTVPSGSTLTLVVGARGSAPLFYQWRVNGAPLAGATRSYLTLSNVQTNQSGLYSVVVSNWVGQVVSTNALLTVQWVNHPPVAKSQSVAVAYNGTAAITLSGSDPDGSAVTYTMLSSPTNGTLSGIAPSLTYQPATNYSGADSFTFKVNDGQLDSAVAMVSITVLPDASKPLINVDFGGGTVSPKTGPAATGHSPTDFWNFYSRDDGQGGWRSLGTVTNLQTAEGAATAANLTVANVPGAWSNGSSDPMYNTYIYPFDGGNVTLTVNSLDAGAYDFYFYSGDYSPITLSVNGLSYGSQSATGTGANNPVVWQEEAQYVVFRAVQVLSGDTVTVTVAPGHAGYAIISGLQMAQVDAPTATPVSILQQPASQTVLEGAEANFAVSASGSSPLRYQWRFNGSDLNGATGSALALHQVTAANAGSYSVRVANPAGTVTSADAVLTVTPLNHPPVAQNQSVTVPFNSATAITLAGSDPDNNTLTYTVVSQPAHGTLSGSAPSLTYLPGTNYSGTDSFTFMVGDGQLNSALATVSITVLPDGSKPLINVDFGANSATSKTGPAATGHTATDLWNFYSRDDGQGGWRSFGALSHLQTAEGALTAAGMTVANAPGAWGNGSSDPMYDVYIYPFDGGNVTITVTNLDAGAYDFYFYSGDYSPITLKVNGLSYGSQEASGNGPNNPVVWQEGGQFVVFEAVQVLAGDTVTVTVAPGHAGWAIISGLQIAQASAPATTPVSIQQQPASQTVAEGSDVTFGVTVSGSSPFRYQWRFNGDDLNGATGASLTLHQVTAVNAGSYSVRVTNPAGAVTSTDAVLTVTAINHPPVAQSQNVTVPFNGSAAITLAGSDPDTNALTYTVVSQPAHGTLSATAPALTYQPATNFSGADSFTFKVNDGELDSAVATVSLTVLGDVGKELVNVDFGAGPSTPEAGPAAIGQSANDFWNFYSRDDGYGNWRSFGVLSNLKTAEGIVTPIGLTVANAPGMWGNGSADPMYNSYIYPFDGGKVVVTVTNLTAGLYDFYVYGIDSAYQLAAGGESYGTQPLPNGPVVNPVAWKEGLQYVVFRGVAVGTGSTPVVLTVTPGRGGYATLSGLQIAGTSTTNHVPVAMSQSVSLSQGATKAIVLTGSDLDRDPLTFSVTSLPAHGTLTGTAPNLMYAPFANYMGSDSFTFTVNDGQVDSAPATVTIQVVGQTTAQLIDVDFGGGTASSETGPAAIGQSAADFWNFYSRDDGYGGQLYFGAVSNLKYVDQTASGAGMTVANAPGAWHDDSTDPMYNIYLYPFDGGNVTITFTNLPAGQYSVLPYAYDGNFEVTVGSLSYGIKRTQDAVSNPPVWTEGRQYARFTNVVVGAGQPLVLTVRPGAYGYSVISGLQLLAGGNPPQPSTNTAPVAVAKLASSFVLPGDTNLCVVSANGSNALVVLDGSLSADANHNPLTYNWFEDSLTPFGSGILVTNSFALGPHELTLAVSDGQAVGTAPLQFQVVTMDGAVLQLVVAIDRSSLDRTTKRELEDVLLSTSGSSEVDILTAFQLKVQYSVAATDPALATALENAAQYLLNLLNTGASL